MRTFAFATFLALSIPVTQVLAAVPAYEKNILLDDDQVHVFEARYHPFGASQHTHGYSRVIYVLQGGVLELAKPDGTANRKVVWRPAETHTVTNIGDSEVRLVAIMMNHLPCSGWYLDDISDWYRMTNKS